MQARQDQDVIQLRHQGQVIPDGTRMIGGNVQQQKWIIQIKHTLWKTNIAMEIPPFPIGNYI